jgi:hypothetical protein
LCASKALTLSQTLPSILFQQILYVLRLPLQRDRTTQKAAKFFSPEYFHQSKRPPQVNPIITPPYHLLSSFIILFFSFIISYFISSNFLLNKQEQI